MNEAEYLRNECDKRGCPEINENRVWSGGYDKEFIRRKRRARARNPDLAALKDAQYAEGYEPLSHDLMKHQESEERNDVIGIVLVVLTVLIFLGIIPLADMIK
jgi:hypothetical protein